MQNHSLIPSEEKQNVLLTALSVALCCLKTEGLQKGERRKWNTLCSSTFLLPPWTVLLNSVEGGCFWVFFLEACLWKDHLNYRVLQKLYIKSHRPVKYTVSPRPETQAYLATCSHRPFDLAFPTHPRIPKALTLHHIHVLSPCCCCAALLPADIYETQRNSEPNFPAPATTTHTCWPLLLLEPQTTL